MKRLLGTFIMFSLSVMQVMAIAMDTDGDGKVSLDEFRNDRIKVFTAKGLAYNERGFTTKFSQLDTDGDGFLTKDELYPKATPSPAKPAPAPAPKK